MKKKTIVRIGISAVCLLGFSAGIKAYANEGIYRDPMHHATNCAKKTNDQQNQAAATQTVMPSQEGAYAICLQGHVDCDGLHKENACTKEREHQNPAMHQKDCKQNEFDSHAARHHKAY